MTPADVVLLSSFWWTAFWGGERAHRARPPQSLHTLLARGPTTGGSVAASLRCRAQRGPALVKVVHLWLRSPFIRPLAPPRP